METSFLQTFEHSLAVSLGVFVPVLLFFLALVLTGFLLNKKKK